MLILIKLTLLARVFKSTEIKHIFHLFRHGARNSTKESAKFPFEEGREAAGDLNLAGIRQQFNLGQLLLKKYPKVFDDSFHPNQINVYSSSFDRNSSSAFSQIYGILLDKNRTKVETPEQKELFSPPSSTADPSNSSEIALPIALARIGPTDSAHNFIFSPDFICPGFKAQVDELVLENKEKHKDFLNKIYEIWTNGGFLASEYSESTEWNFESGLDFSDALISFLWMRSSVSDFNTLAHSLFFRSFFVFMRYSDPELSGLLSSALFAEWKTILAKLKEDLKSGQHRLQVSFFSGHDTNLMSFLTWMTRKDVLSCMTDFYNSNMDGRTFDSEEAFLSIVTIMNASACFVNVSFASNILAEVFVRGTSGVEAHEDLAVKVFFNDRMIPTLSVPLSDFEELLSDGIHSNFYSKCGKEELHKGTAPTFLSVLVIICFVFTLLAFVLLMVLLVKISSTENKKKPEMLYIPQESKKELLDTINLENSNIKNSQFTAKKIE